MIKDYVMRVFHDFHARGKFEKALDATFIALILKKLGAIDVKVLNLLV